jgi:hypothetical protein
MWVKSESNYLNLDNGQSLIVVESKDHTQHRIMMRSSDNVTNLYCVQGGYRSAEDAQEALDALMGSVDFYEVEVPEYEEVEEEDEEEEDEDRE